MRTVRTTGRRWLVWSAMLLLVIGGVTAVAGSSLAQDGTPTTTAPAAGQFSEVSSRTIKLKGEPVIWMINRLTVANSKESAKEATFFTGFLYANVVETVLEREKNRDDPITIPVGSATNIDNKDRGVIYSANGELASAYTVELANPADTQNDLQRLSIGVPFTPLNGDYTMTISAGTLPSGEKTELDPSDYPTLVLVLDGNLESTNAEGQLQTLGPGDAGVIAKERTTTASAAGPASYLVVTLTDPKKTPASG